MEVWKLSGDEYAPLSTDFFMPRYKFEPYSEPDIGEVRFMGWTSFPTSTSEPYREEIIGGTEMIYDREVSGYWVYPHGQTVSCQPNEFLDACRVFAGNERATSFTVKNLSGFMRLNPAEETNDPCKIVPWANGYLREHEHKLIKDPVPNPDQQVTATATFQCGKFGDIGNYLHNGGGTLTDSNLLLSSDEITIEASAAKIDSLEKGLDVETKPAAESLPVIMYVGRKNLSQMNVSDGRMEGTTNAR